MNKANQLAPPEIKEPAGEAGSVGRALDPTGGNSTLFPAAGKRAEPITPVVERVCRTHCWIKTSDGPRHIAEPLDDGKIQLHLAGRKIFGACPIAPGSNTTRLALFDLDSHGGETGWPKMRRVADQVADFARLLGFEPILWRSSGGRGVHIFFLWESDQDAYSVREALREVLDACGFKSGTKGVAEKEIEIFPKNDAVALDRAGSMFVLPGAGKSERLTNNGWPVSAPVILRARPERSSLASVPAELSKLRDALNAIPNSGASELSYDEWHRVMAGIHHATDGSDEGFALAREFNARSDKDDPEFFESRVWMYLDSHRENPITAQTIFQMARSHEDVASDFEVLQPVAEAPAFKRNRKGEILPTIENVVRAVGSPQVCGARIGFDQFRDEIMRASAGADDWRAFTDSDYVELRIGLERGGFKTIPKETIRDAVLKAASDGMFDSAMLWLKSLEWDGTPRVVTFMSTYLGVADGHYARAVSEYFWTALAGRVLEPGIKTDMVPVLVGPQGVGKSSAVAALVPSPDHFVEVALELRDEDQSRKMRGRLVGEIAELRGLRSREVESIKAFITRTHEVWTPKWREFSTTFARRLVFIGTTNSDEFLDDETGNRRWLPLRVGKANVAAIVRDRLQLWAEARDLFELIGVAYQAAERLAAGEHDRYTINDSWEDAIRAWLNETDSFDQKHSGLRRARPVTTSEVMSGALGFSTAQMTKAAEMRAAKVMVRLGYRRETKWLDGKARKAWVA